MQIEKTIRQSFFLKFLLITIFAGNIYVLWQSALHCFNIHSLDIIFRWYPFRVAPGWYIFLVLGSGITLTGAWLVMRDGKKAFRFYFIGKLVTCCAYVVLSKQEYKTLGIDFPLILIPIIAGLQLLYPIVLYLSLRFTKLRGFTT